MLKCIVDANVPLLPVYGELRLTKYVSYKNYDGVKSRKNLIWNRPTFLTYLLILILILINVSEKLVD